MRKEGRGLRTKEKWEKGKEKRKEERKEGRDEAGKNRERGKRNGSRREGIWEGEGGRKQVIQGYHMVSSTDALLIIFESYTEGSRAADPKGTKSCRTQGRISVHPSIHPSPPKSPTQASEGLTHKLSNIELG